MLTEQWLPIRGYEGYYSISNLGRVKSLPRVIIRNNGRPLTIKDRILNIPTNGTGYFTVGLTKNKILKTFPLHHLVWDYFGDKPRNSRKLQVDHIDNNKANNRIDNLQLLSPRDNVTKYHQTQRDLPTGVVKSGDKFVSQIRIGNKIHLGRFDTIEQASKAYQNRLRTII